MNYDWDWAGAERHFERALELNPSHAPARHWFGWYLTLRGRHDEAISQLLHAKQLDPLSLGINWFMSASLCLAGRYDESVEAARGLVDLEPNFWAGHWALAVAHAYKGEYAEAFKAYAKAEALDASPMIRAAHAHARALAGDRRAALAALAELKSRERDAYVPPYYLALIHAALGEPEHALDYLERAYQERDGSLPLLKVDRRLDSLRPDPRLQDLITRLNLAD
jgi:tetratricopeptide (TPR) repeat protein